MNLINSVFSYCLIFLICTFFGLKISLGRSFIVPIEKDVKFIENFSNKDYSNTNKSKNDTEQKNKENNTKTSSVNQTRKDNKNVNQKLVESSIKDNEFINEKDTQIKPDFVNNNPKKDTIGNIETINVNKKEENKNDNDILKEDNTSYQPTIIENTTNKEIINKPIKIDTEDDRKNNEKTDVKENEIKDVKSDNKNRENIVNDNQKNGDIKKEIVEKTQETENKKNELKTDKNESIIKNNNNTSEKTKLRELIISDGEIIENKYVNNFDSDSLNSVELINEIEKNIISREKNSNSEKIDIRKGEWNTRDIIEINNSKNAEINKTSAKFRITTKENNETKKIEELKKIAYKAYKNHEYEIAIKYYKNILKIDPKDNLSKLSLATSYHALKQYRQAKPIYVELMRIYPDNENIVSNLISIIINESPYEAVYIIPSISEKYENSASIQAQTSMSFAKVKNYKEAIKYIKKALYLDKDNIEYLYNMGVLYDMNGEYGKALKLYKDVITNMNGNSNIKKDKLLERIQVLSNLKK